MSRLLRLRVGVLFWCRRRFLNQELSPCSVLAGLDLFGDGAEGSSVGIEFSSRLDFQGKAVVSWVAFLGEASGRQRCF